MLPLPPPPVHTREKTIHLKIMPLVELQIVRENQKGDTNFNTTRDSYESFENKQLFRGYLNQKLKPKPNKLPPFVRKIS